MATYYQLPTGKTLKIKNILDFDELEYQKAMAFDQGEFINNPFMAQVREDNSDNDFVDTEIDDILREYNLPDIESINEDELDIDDTDDI